MERLRAVSVEDVVHWTAREKGRFATLGVDLFGFTGDADAHAAACAERDAGPRCAWCGETLKECERGKAGCGFAIEA